MNQARPEEHRSEAALRARIVAGSEELDDYLELAHLMESDARDDEAIRTYEQALLLHLTKVQRATALTRLGAALDAARGERDRARALAREALDLLAQEPDTVDTLLLRGLSLSRIAGATWFEDPAEAESIGRLALQTLERVIQESTDAEAITAAHFGAAWIYGALGDQEKAIAAYQRSLERPLSAPARAEALNMLAEAYRLAGRLADAEQAASSAVRLVEGGLAQIPRVFVTLGLIRRAAGRPTDARESFTRALEALMQHRFLRRDRELLRTIHGNLAEIEYDTSEYSTAADRLRQLLAQYPEDGLERHRVLIWLGDCYVVMGQLTEARPYYEEVAHSPVAADEERQHARDGLARLRG